MNLEKPKINQDRVYEAIETLKIPKNTKKLKPSIERRKALEDIEKVLKNNEVIQPNELNECEQRIINEADKLLEEKPGLTFREAIKEVEIIDKIREQVDENLIPKEKQNLLWLAKRIIFLSEQETGKSIEEIIENSIEEYWKGKNQKRVYSGENEFKPEGKEGFIRARIKE